MESERPYDQMANTAKRREQLDNLGEALSNAGKLQYLREYWERTNDSEVLDLFHRLDAVEKYESDLREHEAQGGSVSDLEFTINHPDVNDDLKHEAFRVRLIDQIYREVREQEELKNHGGNIGDFDHPAREFLPDQEDKS